MSEAKICDFCHRPFPKLHEFSKCAHKICTICLFQQIFIHHIHEFQGYDYIHVKCKCDIGELDQSIQDVLDLLEAKVQLNKKNEGNLTKEELSKCNIHPNNYLNYYCVDCFIPVCKTCVDQIVNDHHAHRVLPYGKLKKIIRDDINILPLKNKDITLFQQNIDMISKKFVEEVDKNFNNTLKIIDNMIKTAFDFRDNYIKSYKEDLTKYIQSFKIIRVFYMNYFNDKNIASNKENPCNNINLLRYINNIGYELMGAEISHNQEVTKKCTEVQKMLEEFVKQKTKYLKASFNFAKVPRDFRINTILSKQHEKPIKALVELNNERIVTAAFDFSIKVWKDDEEGNGYKLAQTIKGICGKVYCLLLLKDGRLLSSAQNNNSISVWEETEKDGFKITQTLTNHDQPVVTMAELPDGKIVSGSIDSKVFIWGQNSKKFFTKQRIEVETRPIHLVITLFDDSIAYTTDDGIIKLYGINESLSAVQSDLVEYYPVAQLKYHKGRVACMIQLTNGCLVSGGGSNQNAKDHHIIVWKQDGKSYKTSQILDGHDADINSVCQLRDESIASASSDHTIKIWKQKLVRQEGKKPYLMYELAENLTEYNHGLYKIILLKDDRLCSTSSDGSIILWKSRSGTY